MVTVAPAINDLDAHADSVSALVGRVRSEVPFYAHHLTGTEGRAVHDDVRLPPQYPARQQFSIAQAEVARDWRLATHICTLSEPLCPSAPNYQLPAPDS